MIRIISQDKKNDINYANYSIWIGTNGNMRYCIYAFTNFESKYEYETLGTYSTKERAEEVLKELRVFAEYVDLRTVSYFFIPEE